MTTKPRFFHCTLADRIASASSGLRLNGSALFVTTPSAATPPTAPVQSTLGESKPTLLAESVEPGMSGLPDGPILETAYVEVPLHLAKQIDNDRQSPFCCSGKLVFSDAEQTFGSCECGRTKFVCDWAVRTDA